MTKVVFYRSNGIFWGFEEQGHTGFADSGEDVLCSAISSMTMLIINTIVTAYGAELDYDIDEKTTDIRVSSCSALPSYESDEKKRFAVAGLFMAYFYQLNDLVEEYYDYLEVDVIEKEYVGNK